MLASRVKRRSAIHARRSQSAEPCPATHARHFRLSQQVSAAWDLELYGEFVDSAGFAESAGSLGWRDCRLRLSRDVATKSAMNTQHWIRRGRLAACLSSSSRSRSVADVVAASGQRRVNAIDVCSSSVERSSSTKRSSSAAPSSRRWAPTAVLIGAVLAVGALQATLNGLAAEEPAALPKAFVDGTGTGWRALGKDDFTQVNTADNTWTWKPDGSVHCTGQPVGVIRTVKKYTNLELVAEWRHLKAAGNSGIFLWALDEPLMSLKPGQLPHGIEVQVLDLG